MNSISDKISAIKAELGNRLLILGHHYQRSSVIQHADEKGDSLELARKAAANKEAERIIFCGVRFMAESADILSSDIQTVFMPNTDAGCPMADMAVAPEMEAAWESLISISNDWLPVVYVNSSAEIKALCGRHGGSTCTSSNAEKIFKWVTDQGKKIFFLPDEHLGVNTARKMGIPDDEILVYDPDNLDMGGLTKEGIAKAKVVAWKGFCLVHQAFKVEHVRAVRERLPQAKIIVHPETPAEVVKLCDESGSTAQIIDYVKSAEPGSVIVVGTEVNLVQRLALEVKNRGITVKVLSPSVCANMAKTNEMNLLEILESFPERNEVHVPADIARDARSSLERMLEIK